MTGIVLSPKIGLHVRAKRTFVDEITKKKWKAGEEWLVTRNNTEVYFPGINEEIINNNVPLHVLTDAEFWYGKKLTSLT